MVTCFLLGIAWLVAYYVSAGNVPVFDAVGGWSLVIGFGFIVAGFAVATQWR